MKRAHYAWTCLCAILFLIAVSPATANPDGPSEPFGEYHGVTDDANDVFAWVENDGTFTWGPAPATASYCDILTINASQDAMNYSIWVTFASNVSLARFETRFAGVRIFVNLTQLPQSQIGNATLQLVLGGNIYSAGEAANSLSYAQVSNTTDSFNATNVATVTGAVVNFSFPVTFPQNITEFQGGTVKASIDDWSVVAWAWDFFSSTTSSKSGDLYWDGYGDPEFRESWGEGSFTFPFIAAFNLGLLVASIALGVFVIRKKVTRVRGYGGK